MELVVVFADRHLQLVFLLVGEDAQNGSGGDNGGDPGGKALCDRRLLPLEQRDVLFSGRTVDRLCELDLCLEQLR